MRLLIIYPGHSHSTIDVAIGYCGGLKNLGHQVFSYNYHQQLAFYLAALEYWEEANPKFECKDRLQAAITLASEQAVINVVDVVPDFVLVVNGFALHKRALDLINRLCVPAGIILTESPYLDEEQAIIARKGKFRLVFTNDQTSVQPLNNAVGRVVEYLPHSYDPDRHQKICPLPDSYINDVFFFGTLWPERRRLLQPLRRWCQKNKIEASIGGITIEAQPKNLISNEEMVRFYSGAKIAINHHRTFVGQRDGREEHVQDAYSLGPRAFEIAACGTFQLCDDTRPELYDVFGDSVATYKDGVELRDKVRYYLKHDQERKDMAAEAQRCVSSCTFEWRAKEIVVPAIMRVL